jgi:hypothetical protein
MNVRSQSFPVEEIIVGSNEAVGINALVDVVIGAVFDKGNTDITGNLIRGSPEKPTVSAFLSVLAVKRTEISYRTPSIRFPSNFIDLWL